MDNIEEKLGSILSNPQMMQQIMSLAQSLGSTPASEPVAVQEDTPPAMPFSGLDTGLLQKLSGLSGKGGIDPEQKALLQALSPYLPQDRVIKLENAMRAARVARVASAFLGNGGLQMLSGR